MARRSVLPLVAFLLLLVGCTRTPLEPPPTPTLPISHFLPAGSEERPQDGSAPTATMSGEELAAFIAQHLIEGTPESLISELESRGYEFEPGSLVREDLNGDGEREWAMFVLPDVLDGPMASGLFVILEAVNQGPRWRDETLPERLTGPDYRLAYHEEIGNWMGPSPEVLTVQDISGDGRDDLLMHVTGCGVHSCTTEYSLLSYHGSAEPREILQSDPLGGSRPGAELATVWEVAWRLRDWDGDGQRELLLLGNYRGNMASGPQRGVVNIYYLFPEPPMMLWMQGAWLPTNVRYFRLRDSDILIGRQMYREAVALLDEVVHSGTLVDSGWDGMGTEPRDENGDVRRFAYLRLMQAAMLVGDRPLAKRYLDEMAASWPEHALTSLADYMLYANPRDFWAACEMTAANASTVSNLTGALADMGWSNPPITNQHFCPIRGFGDALIPALIPDVDYDPAILP